MVQVHHDEGVANRIDPESCANTREGIGEALTGIATEYASADSPAGKMVAAGRHRLLQLPRGADKQFDTDRVPIPRHQSLAAHATAAEPERLDDLGADQAVGRRLASETANPSSMASESLRRQTPEVGAVCPNWARTDLCGGREVTRVPTATVIG